MVTSKNVDFEHNFVTNPGIFNFAQKATVVLLLLSLAHGW
jgi:hypothetical protein